MARIYNKL